MQVFIASVSDDLQNDDLISALQRQQPATRAGASTAAPPSSPNSTAALSASQVSFAQVNRYIGGCLAGLLLPSNEGGGGSGAARVYDVRSRIPDLVARVCPHPALKFMEARTAPLPPATGLQGGGARDRRGG